MISGERHIPVIDGYSLRSQMGVLIMKKRTILGYLFTFCVMVFCFSAVYSFNYSRLRGETAQDDRTESESGRQTDADPAFATDDDPEKVADADRTGNAEIDTEGAVTDGDEKNTGDDHLAAAAGDELRTNGSMVYVVGQYDWITGIVTETVEKFPEELLNLTRQELLVYLKEHPEYGTLLSFSEHAVYLRKSDDQDWSEYSYYLILEDDRLMVYHLDQKTLYLDTGILAEELTDENRKLLEEGFYIRDTTDLFDYLQTVTS